MTGYSLALFLHLLFVLLATAGMVLTSLAVMRLRRCTRAVDARHWVAFTERVVPVFPIAVLGLVLTGAYMTHERWTWSTPWVEAALTGLAFIVVLGTGIEGSRLRALKRELDAAGLSERAWYLLCDPVTCTSKVVMLTLVVAVVFVMTVKPLAAGSVAAIAAGVASGVVVAMPMWRPKRAAMPEAAAEG